MNKPRKTAAPRRKNAPQAVPSSKAEKASPATAVDLSEIYQHADAALFSLVVETRSRLRLHAANRRFFELSGLNAKKVLGRTLDELLPPPVLARVMSRCRKVLRTHETVRWDEGCVLKSGARQGLISLTPVADAAGRVTHLSGSIHDITGHRRSEQALKESEERYRRIVQDAQEGVWTIDARSLTDYVNPKMAEMMGYKAEEMLGRPISDFLDDEGRALLTMHIKNRKNGISDHFEFKYMRKDGSALWAFVSTNPIYN